MVPHLLKNWELTRRPPRSTFPAKGIPGALFYRRQSHHPWPALDLIALLPGLKAGDHVALHDTNLPAISDGRFPSYGVQWLFEDWMGDRLVPEVATPNIGALVIPATRTSCSQAS